MARAGRKRKPNVKRHPGGQAVRDTVIEMTPEHLQIRVAAVGASNIKAFDGTLLHCMKLRGEISAIQCEAGKRFDSIVKRYKALLCVPPEGNGHSSHREGIDDPEEFNQVREAYNRAFEAIGGRMEKRAVRKAIRDEHIQDLVCLRSGLDGLAQHYGLSVDGRWKSA